MMKKRLVMLISCLLAVIISIPQLSVLYAAEEVSGVVPLVNNSISYAKEATKIYESVEEENLAIIQSEQRKVEVDESIAETETDLASKNTSVPAELEKRIAEYENKLNSASNVEERARIQNLLEATEGLLADYILYDDSLNNSSLVQSRGAFHIVYTPYVAAAIAGFSALSYELSAELLTFARANSSQATVYRPEYGSRVWASQVTHDIANGTKVEGGTLFPHVFLPTHEADLFFSIHEFSYTKVNASSKAITITDTYNFHNEKTDYVGLLDGLTDLMYYAQEEGTIVPFDVVIEEDLTNFPTLSIVSKVGSTWKIKIKNDKNVVMSVVYNSKMCSSESAEFWRDLLDVKTINVPANSTITVDIEENFLATHIVIAFYNKGTFYIAYANELNANGNLTARIITARAPYYENIGLITKNGDKWLINITNTFGERRKVEYNTKFCNEGDAKNWTGLNNITSFHLDAGESRNIEIQDNWFATYIAISFVSDTQRDVVYANNLVIYGDSSNTLNKMDVGTKIIYIYKYLTLSNVGKDWGSCRIKVTNPTNSRITVTYNTKFCNEGDARNWTGLNDLKEIRIAANETAIVVINNNWASTYVAFSYHSNGGRLISYANGIDSNKNINVKTNRI